MNRKARNAETDFNCYNKSPIFITDCFSERVMSNSTVSCYRYWAELDKGAYCLRSIGR